MNLRQPLAPEGVYVLRAEGVKSGQSSKGNAMWTVDCESIGGPVVGARLRGYVVWTPAAARFVREFAAAFGFEIAGDEVSIDPDEVTGRIARGRVERYEYVDRNGVQRVGAKVAQWLPPEPGDAEIDVGAIPF